MARQERWSYLLVSTGHRLASGLSRDRHGRTVIAGAIGLLTGVECLFSTKAATEIPVVAAPVLELPVVVTELRLPESHVAPRKARLKVSQTRSELGYVYWVVREVGGRPSFALFDTWQEAMDEVARRIRAAALTQEPESVLIPA